MLEVRGGKKRDAGGTPWSESAILSERVRIYHTGCPFPPFFQIVRSFILVLLDGT
jgi:hypothetical protein